MDMLKKHLDLASFIVITATFVLFAAALFVKGLTHDLFLEVGVFLVSVKLIISSFKLASTARDLEEKIERNSKLIEEALKKHSERE